MQVEILADADAMARRAADVSAVAVRDIVRTRGRCVIAVSGGRTGITQ
jgi:6-phosphogluconolactonase/glucosamine-6-phosphate isomerase/deaminase